MRTKQTKKISLISIMKRGFEMLKLSLIVFGKMKKDIYQLK